MDLALNNLQRWIYYKTQTSNQPEQVSEHAGNSVSEENYVKRQV